MLLSLLLVLIFVLSLYRADFRFLGFNDDCLSKYRTDSIKGIFILLIVLTHSLQYVLASGYAFDGVGDRAYFYFLTTLNQLVVVMFLFYSGYGIGESFKKKGADYVKSMPKHRVLGTLLNFDVAVIVFIIACLALGITVTLRQCLLSFVAWDSVGNSEWYIFVILTCYILSYLTLTIVPKKSGLQVGVMIALCLLTIVALSFFKHSWWYNTLLSYPTGFAFSAYKDKAEVFLKKYYWPLLVLLCLALVSLHLCTYVFDHMGLVYNAKSIVFAFLILMITLKCSVGNSVLEWFGKNLFPVYIYMRLPMMVIEHKSPGLITVQPAVFIIVSFALTVLIASLYKFWQIRL